MDGNRDTNSSARPQGLTSDVRVRLRARSNGETTEVKLLMLHPMETGLRRDAHGVAIPPDFISQVLVRHNDEIVFEVAMSIAIASDPLLSFEFQGGRPGDPIEVEWQDNQGADGRFQTTVT